MNDDGSETENAEGGGDGSEANQLLSEGAVQLIARQILETLGSVNPAAGGDSSSSSTTNTHTGEFVNTISYSNGPSSAHRVSVISTKVKQSCKTIDYQHHACMHICQETRLPRSAEK